MWTVVIGRYLRLNRQPEEDTPLSRDILDPGLAPELAKFGHITRRSRSLDPGFQVRIGSDKSDGFKRSRSRVSDMIRCTPLGQSQFRQRPSVFSGLAFPGIRQGPVLRQAGSRHAGVGSPSLKGVASFGTSRGV